MNAKYPRLVADIGGTNARFAIEREPFELTHIDVLACEEYPTLVDAINVYLKRQSITLPNHTGIAIANPVHGDEIVMTNNDWRFSISEVKKILCLDTLWVINDFTAQALAITKMSEEHLTLLHGKPGGSAIPKHETCAVLGPGTGLGVSGLVPDGYGGMISLASEGGHVTFSPCNVLESELATYAEKQFGYHISVERLLQGNGLLVIYRFLAEKRGEIATRKIPSEITQGALLEGDTLCRDVLSQYCAMLGSFSANTVLTLGSFGGVYLTGGIVPRFVDFLRQSAFRKRFEDKGRMADYLRNVPVYVVAHPYPGVLGAAVALNNHLKAQKQRV